MRKRAEVYADKPQYIYEFVDQNYEKPIIMRAMPFVSNYLSKEEGVIGVYLKLNDDLKPSIQIRYADPMTDEKIWNMLQAEKWIITYAADDVREVDPKMKFDKKGVVRQYNK